MDTSEQIIPEDDLVKKLAECETKRDEYLSGWQRERADFQNYKKEEMKRAGELRGMLTESIIHELLPVLDSFDIAFDFLPEDPATQKWAKGWPPCSKQATSS